MRKPLPGAFWVSCLVGLAAVAWAVVVAEYRFVGTVSLMSLAPALMFTSFLVLWPFVGDRRRAAPEGPSTAFLRRPCHDCGALLLPTPRIKFCLRCGAFPKPVSTYRPASP